MNKRQLKKKLKKMDDHFDKCHFILFDKSKVVARLRKKHGIKV